MDVQAQRNEYVCRFLESLSVLHFDLCYVVSILQSVEFSSPGLPLGFPHFKVALKI